MAATTKLKVWNAALREIGAGGLVDTTTVNATQREVNDAWDHAVETVLAMHDWGFARRRSTRTGTSDTTSFPPYTYSYSKPTDYLRKCWIKSDAADEAQLAHAEIAASFYGYEASVLLEYVSDHADNYDPANWPPHFTKVLTLHLAALVAPKLARAGADDLGRLNGQMMDALQIAKDQEAVFLINASIDSGRLPVMRRALEFLGQQLAGSVSIHAYTDMLRWHMNRSWDHALKYVLEQGAWNFATRRVTLTGGTEPVPGDVYDDIIEGYIDPPDSEAADSTLPDMAGWDYGHNLPADFLHKIWLRSDANATYEIPHQFMRDAVYTNYENVVMEYVAWDTDSQDPGEWSANFTEAVAAYLALLVSPELVIEAGSKGAKVNATGLHDKLYGLFQQRLSDAKLRDAIQQYPASPPAGRFVRARRGSSVTALVRR